MNINMTSINPIKIMKYINIYYLNGVKYDGEIFFMQD